MARRNRRERAAGWDPFQEFSALQNQMSRLFQSSFGDFGFGADAADVGEFVPPADIFEDDNNVELRVELPGVDEKDLNITIQDNVLTVEGERKLQERERRQNFLRRELPHGRFSRSFTLPGSASPEHVNASYVNGILHIRLGKRAEAKPKRIQISSGQKALEGVKAA
ncbi:MAG TPA: Hsp20/alpha crystallin family protein [Terriglobales bacterium]|nr:Hsp20/alpha crystallin family protein [Terriglobales bacterium]